MLAIELFNPFIFTVLLMFFSFVIPAIIFIVIHRNYIKKKELNCIENQKVIIRQRLSDIGIKTT